MEWPPAFYLWVVLFAFQLWVHGCFGCFYEEESALLELKSSINPPNRDSLPSWRVGTDCCTWKGVTCSSTIGRVIGLDLSSTRDYLDVQEQCYLNASLLLPFEELQSLDLSWNGLIGFIDEEAMNSWSRLSKLEELDLRYNQLNATILPFLCALKSLKKLEIGSNDFEGPLPIKAFETLTSLRTFDASWSGFNDSQSIQGFCKLKELQRLDLSNNNFKGPLPLCLSNLTSLQLLNLSSNRFSGMLPTSTTGNDESQGPLPINEATDGLQEVEFITKRMQNYYKGGILNYMSGIDVSYNQLTGEIPREMGQLSGLHSMNLSYNQFSGPIPATFKNLRQIESLDLSHNKLNGTIPPELIELNFLEVFSVAHNNLSGSIPDMKSQFSTFSESSYEGNQLLCGPPLSRSCISTTPISEAPEEDENEDDDNIVSFYGSFAGSYLVFLIGTIGVLYFTSQSCVMCFLYVVDSWCAFRPYKLYMLFSCK